MNLRTAQAMLIVILCAMSVYYALVNTRRIPGAPWLKTLQYIQMFVLAYIGGLYFLASVKSLAGLDVGLTMDFYRPGILLLVITIFADKIWRYRAGAR